MKDGPQIGFQEMNSVQLCANGRKIVRQKLPTLLHVVRSCCANFETSQTSNVVQTVATSPNNAGSCWPTIGTLRPNDATATTTSLKKVYLRSSSLYKDYSYPITLSNVGEPS